MGEHKNRKAAAQILAAGTGWGIIGVFSRPLSAAGLSVIQITAIRCLIVAAGMAIILLIRDRSQFRIRLRDLPLFAGIGILSLVFFNVCYFLTIQQATLAAASILLYTAPFFVLLASAFLFHEPVTPRKLVALFLAFGGCVLVSGSGGGRMGAAAILTGIGSGIGYGLYSILGSVALKRCRPFTMVFYAFLIAAAALLPFCRPAEIGAVLAAGRPALVCALALGLVSTLLPFLLYTTGLQQMEAGRAAVLAFAEPMVAALSGIVVFQEALTWQSALGIALIFGAIVLLNCGGGAQSSDRRS